MKKILLALLAIPLVSGCFTSIGGGKRVVCKGPVILKNLDEELQFPDFDKIVLNGHADLKYVQEKDGFGVQVEANEEVFGLLDFHVTDGTLYLETKDNVQIVADEFDIYVGSPVLSSVTVNGAADATIIAIDEDEDLQIAINGAGDCELQNISVPGLSVMVSGAADIDATGLDVDNLYVGVSGTGDVDLQGRADYVNLTISGVGSVDISKLSYEKIDINKSGIATVKTK